MAYVNQEKKAKIAAALKAVIPADWKYSLAVSHHSKLVLTIASAPIDFAELFRSKQNYSSAGHFRLNHYYLSNVFQGELLTIFESIRDAMNTDNFDNSDIQTDYFHVGHYIEIQIGRWNKPFQFKPRK